MKCRLLLWMCLSMGCMLLAGCGEESGSTQPGNNGEETGPREPVEIIFYSNAGTSVEDFNELYGEPIQEKLPHIIPNYIRKETGSTFREVLASGQPIDIVYDSINAFPETVIDSGLSYDMSELIRARNLDLTVFDKTMIDAMREFSGGGLFGLPVRYSIMVLYYNQDIFDKFGVEYPGNGMTWEEAIALGNRLTRMDGETRYVGLSLSEGHYMRMNPFGLPYVDPTTLQPTVNTDPKWSRLFQTILLHTSASSVYQDFISSNNNRMPSTPAFSSQHLAMMGWLNGSDFEGFNWDIVSMPTFAEAPGIGVQAYPTYYSVASTSRYKEDAMEVIEFLVSDEFQTMLASKGFIPAVNKETVKQALGTDSSKRQLNYSAYFHNELAPISYKHLHDSAIETEYRREVNKLITRQLDLNSFLRAAEERANARMAQLLQQ